MRAAIAVGCALLTSATAYAQGPYSAVPKASCSPGDRPESGLQGQVPVTERAQIFAGFSCNLRLIGQWEGEGASWQHASYRHCAYYSQADKVNTIGDSSDTNPDKPLYKHPGTVVVDASDPTRPKASAYLDDVGTNDSWESIETNERRHLVASAEEAGPGFAIYDIRDDCAHPRKLFAGDLEGNGHAGGFAPDGRTYWSGPALRAIDIDDPTKPRVLAPDELAAFNTHDLGISDDGKRAYLARSTTSGSGLTILDVSDVQARRPEPRLKVVAELGWTDGSIGQNAMPVTIGGKPYLVFTDENGTNSLGQPVTTALSCAQGKPPFGMARLIDISDESKPRVVSMLPLEVTLPENCPRVVADNAGTGIFGYDAHYCSVDDPADARVLACSYFQSGLRVFDISDPRRPKEIAYYNPPMKPGYKPGSNYNLTGVGSPNGADWSAAHPQFRLERREIWITSHMNGFQALRFSDGVGLPVRRGRATADSPSAGGQGRAGDRDGASPRTASPRPCTTRRTLTVRLPSRLRWARIYLNGKRVRTLRGKRLRSRVTLRGLPRGTLRVRVVARTRGGRRVVRRHRYGACASRSSNVAGRSSRDRYRSSIQVAVHRRGS